MFRLVEIKIQTIWPKLINSLISRFEREYPDLAYLDDVDEAFCEDDSMSFDSEKLHNLSKKNGLIIDVVRK